MITTFSVMRPTLAQELVNNGINYLERKPSVVNPTKQVWIFKADTRTAQLVKQYYDDRGIDVPEAVQIFLKGDEN